MVDAGVRKLAFTKLERLEVNVNAIDPDTVTEGQIRIYIKTADDCIKKIEDHHGKIIAVLRDDQAINDQEDILKPMEQKYQEIMAKLYNFQVTTGASNRPTQQLKLPDIQLPSFDGKYEDWPSFSDLFRATIEKNSSLSPSQKLQYLKTCTRGEAHNLVRTFTITDNNYKEAWKLLSQRYSNTREIVSSIVKRLVNQQAIKIESATSLQSLLNTTLESLRSLQVMGRPTQHWDDLVTFIIIDKLDGDTRAEWARSLKGSDPPTFQELHDFLEQHIRTLHAKGFIKQQSGSRNQPNQSKHIHHNSFYQTSCLICKESHQLYRCPKLIAMQVDKRVEAVKAARVCLNCLREGHMAKECTSTSTCRKCNRKHNTFLHKDDPGNKQINSNSKSVNATYSQSQQQSTGAGSSKSSIEETQPMRINFNTTHTDQCATETSSSDDPTLLKTALVDVLDDSSTKRQVRVFLDDGAQGSLIRESTLSKLGLPRMKTDVTIQGFNNDKPYQSRWKTQIRLFSQIENSFIDVTLYSVPRVSGKINFIPSTHPRSWSHIRDLKLADPHFHEGGEVDILLGVDAVPYTLKNGIKHLNRESPVAQNTMFGWVLFGNVQNSLSLSTVKINACEISSILRLFWEMEEIPNQSALSLEEKSCEENFLATHRRNEQGRYIVRLPFKENKDKLGSTKEQAYRRLLSLERKFIRQPQHKQAYINFMREYESLGHMEKVSVEEKALQQVAYLPHHFVLKEDSTTTKQRTVFDGSAKSSTGISLNDILMVGATVQPDLFTLIIRFRLFIVALKADFAKMYRQFLVEKEDCNYQRILWREESSLPVEEYRLLTLTYGTAPAAFLATRCLKQLAIDEAHQFNEASTALLNNTYVDDFLGGANSPEEAEKLVQQLILLATAGGMELRKWCSNIPSVLSSLPSSLKEECNTLEFSDNSSDSIKALGIKWSPSLDCFLFSVIINKSSVVTKRHILSEVAKTFDPMGWLSPITIRAKLLLQKLWLEGQDWDQQISSHLQEEWNSYLENLKQVEDIRIPRCVVVSTPVRHELGYSDSSELAMAGAVYLKVIYVTGAVTVNLLTSKTKVAPLKTISLPKLELSAAKLLAETIHAVQQALEVDATLFCWTDSTITLRWISSHSRRWKTYVANRVSIIQTHVPPECWHHVKGEENPADLPSRGVSTEALISSQLWWTGPAWLQQETYPVHAQQCNEEEIKKEERTKQLAVFHLSKNSTHSTLFSSVSSFTKLCRISAYLIRFVVFLKSKKKTINKQPITTVELNQARIKLIQWAQHASFPEAFIQLQRNNQVSSSSKLLQLNPFIDNEGTLRVGGRIQRANLPSASRNPIILSSDHPLSTLIIRETHLLNLHSGFTLTLATIRRKYWILRGRDAIRHAIRKCIICRRHRAAPSQQLMGSLPAGRVNATKAFLHTGVDFAGPFSVKIKKGRFYSIEKVYFAIFVCLATKAIHLESVDSLSSEAFIATFERFISRRGCCAHMYSDNGTNFVGADRIMKQFLQDQHSKIQQQLCNRGTQWHFNPPSAPHQGGLWEAGVKSVKFHFHRVVGQSVLVLDQFITLLCKIEACLNSRPICALSSDPTDLDALTPGHFLVGGPLTSIPEPDVTLIKQNRLSYWETVRQISQTFWKRWSSEYVTTLQQRFKWTQKRDNLRVDDLVVIMDEQLPMTKWKLGRIIKTHPGADGLVRSVTLKTAVGELTRPINKLSPLILQTEI